MAATIALASPAIARAQACCAGGTVLTPGRLNLHEDALVAVQVKGSGIIGSYDGKGQFVHPSPGAAEGDFEEDLIASLRVLSRGQVTLLVPIVETYVRASGLAAAGGSIGDLSASARWDATLTGASLTIPGVAVLASLVLPTGSPPESAPAHATGAGTVQGALGLSVEQTYGKVLVNLTGSAKIYSARIVQGIHTQLGPAFGAFAALGYSFEPGPVVAITASYTASVDSKNDGVRAPDSARTQLVLGLAAGYQINDAWRVQASFFGDPPAPHAGENETATVGLSATVFRTW